MGNLSSSIVWMLGGMALASTVLLSACDSGTTSASNPTNVAKPVAPAELPPAIEKSVTYRCQDNGLVPVDFLIDGLKIGRASCRERVCQYVEISEGAGTLKTQKKS